jgi:hypothetical protein
MYQADGVVQEEESNCIQKYQISTRTRCESFPKGSLTEDTISETYLSFSKGSLTGHHF